LAGALILLGLDLPEATSATAVDHHQHLFSPAVVAFSPSLRVVTVDELMPQLDAAGIQRAVVLSQAYQFGNPNRPPVEDEYAKVMAENDWTGEQVARFPDRLRAFCGVNPLRVYALQEIARCARDPRLKLGLKLHFGNSDVDLEDPRHVEQVRKVFEAANRHGMAIIVHMRSSVSRKRPYGAAQARAFVDHVLPSAPDVPVQIAHLAGAGSYDDPLVDEAVGALVTALASSRFDRLYFDVSGVAGLGNWMEKRDMIVARMRQLGLHRILYGSDGAVGEHTPDKALSAFRKLPLTAAELEAIESRVAPYMR
jgi:predicted TIM-barrel fold metal-dependent hydrolase